MTIEHEPTSAEAGKLVYDLVDLQQLILEKQDRSPEAQRDFRDRLISAIRTVCEYVAGSDGTSLEEKVSVNLVLWQDVTEVETSGTKEPAPNNESSVEPFLAFLEAQQEMIAEATTELTDEPYCAENDPVLRAVSAACQAVLAADQPEASELERLGALTTRLRKKTVDLEATMGGPHHSDPDLRRNEATDSAGMRQGTTEEKLLSELHRLVGLENVKQQVETLANLAKVFARRRQKGLPVPPMSFHLVFLGNPGTGKTTVARIISQLYGQLGLLSSGHLIEVDRSGLVGNYIGQTATKVQEVIAKAMGGVLFIDEAYSLAGRGEMDFGNEAIETLLKAMEDNRENLIVIVAGYMDRMQEFLASNPGLRSRFARDLEFTDYTPDEMVEIFRRMAEQSHYRVDIVAEADLTSILRQRWEHRGPNFANARDVRNFFEASVSAQANRLSCDGLTDEDDLCTLTNADLQQAAQQQCSIAAPKRDDQ